MEDYLDLRIVKTRQVLITTLFDILKKQINNKPIKVLDICKKANISAITFYKHFDNKNNLLEYSIKEQLNNHFPIPIKLKPHNLKQLIYYLINFFEKFCQENNELIINCSKIKSDIQMSYFNILLKIIEYNVFQELKNIYSNKNFIELNMWTETVVAGLFYLFIKRTTAHKIMRSETVFNSYNQMIKAYII